MNERAAAPSGRYFWTSRRRFKIDGLPCEVAIRSRTDGLDSELRMFGVPASRDWTPLAGPESVRNHRLNAILPDGRNVEVEAGWVGLWSVGIAVTLDGRLIHESHPGRTIAYPEKYREWAVETKATTFGGMVDDAWKEGAGEGLRESGVDLSTWRRNRVPLAVDISLGILFYVVAKLTDLSTAALVGAGAGLALVVAQRFVKVDLLGGLALFGIVMLLISAGFALVFQDDMAVKLRGTIVGLISATLFLGDGLLGGNRLGKGLARYLPYSDLDPGRLAIGMGALGLVMASLNLVVALLASTDVWLFYSTFVDFFLIMVMILLVFRYARGKPLVGGRSTPA